MANTAAHFSKRVSQLPVLDIAFDGVCATHACVNFYNPSTKKYLQKNDATLGTSDTPPEGKWLIHKTRHRIYWLPFGAT